MTIPALTGCSQLVHLTTPTATTASPTVSAAHAQQLDDWRIRAGLYAANREPMALPYVPDSGLASWSASCRQQVSKLGPFRRGLVNAPDRVLARLARAYDGAARGLLAACQHNRPVLLHRAEGQLTVTASAINVRYARLLGEDPNSVYAKRVF